MPSGGVPTLSGHRGGTDSEAATTIVTISLRVALIEFL